MSEALESSADTALGVVGVDDLRRQSVERLMSRCDFPRAHADQVHFLADRLAAQLARQLLLGPEARQILSYAALLHDIGWHFGRTRHHRHAYNLITTGGLSGFTPDQIEMIALVARYHRRARPKLKHQPLARLNTMDRETVTRLAALLRVADGLDRGHRAAIQDVAVRLDDRRALLMLQPRVDDVNVELQAAGRKKKLLESVLRRAVVFSIGPDRPERGPQP